MPGGKRDSSRTRVAPFFDRACVHANSRWPEHLLALAEGGTPHRADLDLSWNNGPRHWGKAEKGLRPPKSLLAWLVRNIVLQPGATEPHPDRQRLLVRDPEATARALNALEGPRSDRAWFIFEGKTFPDAYIETPEALVVIEGKRTEPAPTTSTKWMAGRHQIWRHIDAAWEIRGSRAVYGMFIVEGDADGAVPPVWRAAVTDALRTESLEASLPHRTAREREEIARCLVGVTTWQRACEALGVYYASLPDTTDDPGGKF